MQDCKINYVTSFSLRSLTISFFNNFFCMTYAKLNRRYHGIKGVSFSKETGAASVEVLQDNLVLSTGLRM